MIDSYNSKEEYSKAYKKHLVTIIDSVSDGEIIAFIDVLLNARKNSIPSQDWYVEVMLECVRIEM